MTRRDRADRLRSLVETEGPAVRDVTRGFNAARSAATAAFGEMEERREAARAIKEDAIERLPELVETVTAAVEATGGTVHVAEDAAEAARVVGDRCADADVAVKSKSMTTEEIELNEHLEDRGVTVWETDLGEFVVQIAGDTPSHLVAPGMHQSRDEIADLLEAAFDPDDPLETAADLTRFASDFLGDRIEAADVGVTGANFVLAESGSIVLVTNEGNARKCATAPDVHVAVAGLEKLIPSVDDLGPFLELIARSGTGQDITQYVSVLSPPVDSPTLDFDRPDASVRDPGDREFHLVLVDNGRRALRDDEQLRETLYCIRCGACANACANFQHVGGHAFGGETYTGGIAAGWEAGVHGLEAAEPVTDLCTGCSRCVPACPVGIDIPWINTVVRDRLHRGDDGLADPIPEGLSPHIATEDVLERRFFGALDTLLRLASRTAPVSNRLLDSRVIRTGLERVVGLDADRDLPTVTRRTLHRWYTDRGPRGSGERGEVALYPDLYTNYVRVERGQAAVRVLEALGYDVVIPRVPETGRIALSQGHVAAAEARARRVSHAVAPMLDDGIPIVVVEPSDLAMLRREYARLLPAEDHARLADATVDALAVVRDHVDAAGDTAGLRRGHGERVVYHGHCQGRTVDAAEPAVAVLDRAGYAVARTDAECCGMAGSFGYKAEFASVSRAVVDSLAADLPGDARPVASGASCAEQLESSTDRHVPHPIELLDPGA